MENCYDVFISYSREDSLFADAMCVHFDEAKIKYFIDRKGLPMGSHFPKHIAMAILSSKLFLYLASEKSYKSKFANKEIAFALNNKDEESIIPYIIDNSTLPIEMQLEFADVNIINSKEIPVFPNLVNDLLFKLGRKCYEIAGTTVKVNYIKTKDGLNNLVSDFTSINGNIDTRDLDRIIANANDIAYAIVPIGDGVNRFKLAVDTLERSLKLGIDYYSKMVMYIKLSENDRAMSLDEMNEIRQFFDKYSDSDHDYIWSLAPAGIRSELFVIMSR